MRIESQPVAMPPYKSLFSPSSSCVFCWSAASFLLLLGWDYSALDLTMARWFGSANGFAYESHWLWRGVLHDSIRWLPWVVELALLGAIARPFGAIRHLEAERRAQLALTTLAVLILVSTMKLHSRTSCPWDLQEFGGVAAYVSHWSWGIRDGGTGGCFPGGHASAGFAFIGGFFAFRHRLPATAMRWLAGAMLAGLVLGFAQQVRGAHYMSHTLWTAWICWAAAAAIDGVVSQALLQKRSPAQAQVHDLAALQP